MSMRSFFKRTVPAVACSTGVRAAVAWRYGGRGVIFMLHSVVADARFRPDAPLRCPVGKLEEVLGWLRGMEVEFVGMDDVPARLARPGARPFAAFTFDDGYADVLDIAAPLMERFGAPFTVYVPTGMVTRAINAWWLGLAALVSAGGFVQVAPSGPRFDCRSEAGQAHAYAKLSAQVRNEPDTLPAVNAALAAAGIDVARLVDAEALDAASLRRLAERPGVTIGGHSVSHPHLAQLSAEAVRAEMVENRRFLEAITGRPVRHFAYPFGHAKACGAREAEIAAAAGFATAVTTRRGALLPAHLRHLQALPREPLSGEDTQATLRCKVGGFYRAVYSRWGDPVAHM